MHWQAVFLDREGIVTPALKPGEYVLRSEQALVRPEVISFKPLTDRRVPIFLVSNQSCINRGLITKEEAWRLHELIVRELAERGICIKESRLCPHQDQDACVCRKPKPGMIIDLCLAHGLEPSQTVMIGDQRRDAEAGQAAGCGLNVWVTEQPDGDVPAGVCVVRDFEEAMALL